MLQDRCMYISVHSKRPSKTETDPDTESATDPAKVTECHSDDRTSQNVQSSPSVSVLTGSEASNTLPNNRLPSLPFSHSASRSPFR